MKTLTADESLFAVLRQATTLAEVRDPQGRLIGFFAPVTLQDAAAYARAAARFDPAEIRRRSEAPGRTYTTQEVLEHLRSLEAT